MQCDGKRIQLIPTWPLDWGADFKLHAPDQTTVQASVRRGKIVELHVTPHARQADVVVIPSPAH